MAEVGKRYRSIWRLAFVAVCGLVGTGCSLIYAINDECQRDEDCAALGEGLQCRSGLCVTASDVDAGPVVDKSSSSVMPVDLLGATCSRVYGAPLDEPLPSSALVIGALHPLTGQLDVLGRALDQATEMAITEINQVGGIFGRKFVVVTCDTETNPSTAVAAARHLVDVVKVPAVLGPFASELAITVYNEVFAAADVAMVTAGANSPVVADIAANGLLWSTSMSAARQGRAIVEMLLAQDPKKVALVNRDDTWGNAMREEVQDRYCAAKDCSVERYMSRTYGVGDVTVSQSQVVTELDQFAPDVVVLLAYVADAVSFLTLADASQSVKNILTNDSARGQLAFQLVPPGETLCRLVGTTAAPPSGPVFESFVLRFEAKWGPGTVVPYTAHGYDAAYLLALAMSAALAGEEPVAGGTISAAMSRLSAGEAIEPGSQRDWVRGIQALSTSSQTTIDYVGASGSVDFATGAGSVVTGVEAYRLNLERKQPESLGTVFTVEGTFKEPDLSGVIDSECAPYLNAAPAEEAPTEDPPADDAPADETPGQ